MVALVARSVVPLTLMLVASVGCKRPPPQALREPGTRVEEAPPVAEPIFGGGLRTGWEDLASESGGANDGGPRRLELTGPRGWILTNSKLRGSWGGLVFRFRASATFGDFFEVRLDSDTAELFPRVLVSPCHRKELEGGWSEAFIPMNELNPRGAAFIRLVLRSVRPLPSPGLVELDGVGLTQSDPNVSVQPDQVASALGMPSVFVVDCSAQPSPISPLIYGLGFSPSQEFPPPSSWRLKPTARRWGGVAASRYNWELGSAWNPGAEGFFQNVNLVGRPDFSWRTFLEIDVDRGVKTALTVPMVGWVAKDMTSAGFPVAEYGKQEQESDRGGGNGIARDGTLLKPSTPLRTSVPAPPDFIGQWVTAIKAFEKKHGPAVSLYQLDDEPDRWAVTHRDVHPSPVTYDELLERTVGYASAIRKADPTAVIAGPALSGWVASQLSAEDLAAGPGKKPDRLAHGDVALIEWFLAKLAAHEKRTGLKPLDVLDLHYFPTAKAIGRGVDGATDPQTNALRIQATRSLWDSRFVEEGLDEPVALIKRMQEWVDKNDPGLGLSIGAYSFGAERHMSGGLAVAEALGHFGQEGLDAAFYWSFPPEGSPAAYAFRAFRDFDGKGAAFETLSMPHSDDPKNSALFAARSADGRRVTVVMLNESPGDALDASVKLDGCPVPEAQRVFAYSGGPTGFVQREIVVGQPYRLAPYSMTVVELRLPAPKPAR